MGICKVCKEKFKGRSDKMFCSDQCRASFNNQNKKEGEREIRVVNSILRKNRTILKSINPQGKSTVKKEFLELSGFDFRFFTTYFKTANSGVLYFFIYEFGYCDLGGGKILVINRQAYMDRFPNVLPTGF